MVPRMMERADVCGTEIMEKVDVCCMEMMERADIMERCVVQKRLEMSDVCVTGAADTRDTGMMERNN